MGKKILFILPSLIVGGLENVQVTLANALAKRGHEVTVMTFDPGDDLAYKLEKNVRFIYKKPKYEFMKKIPKIRYLFDDGLWETRASAKKLHRYYVGKEKYDVEIAFFRGRSVKIISGTHTDFKKKSVRTKTLAWVHNDFERASGYQSNFKSMEHVFRAYRGFDKVVCVSKHAEQSFKKVIGDTGNVTTVYNMLPVKDIKSLANDCIIEPKNKFNIVVVARLLDSAKGHLRLISAVKALQDECIDIGLTIVGGGPDENMIRGKITELSAENYVHMVGMQKNPYPYIKSADLLVCSSYFEGYNLTVAEALICGTPVLSTDCTGPCEILDGGRYGMIVENSEDGIRDGLRNLATNAELLSHYRKMTTERTEFFNEEKIIAQIEALWK
ncbi:MAG: glycosyltransferase [Clostridia bacterium]|nr:glycosyltransferase [Clostridia bacterium]